MNRYTGIYNYTKKEWSSNEYRNGIARISEVLILEPTWESSDIIVGGAKDSGGYFFLNGGQGKVIRNLDTMFVLDHDLTTGC